MNDYIEKNGETAIIYTQTGRNSFTTKEIPNTTNIEERLANDNRLERINNEKNKAKRELDKLSFERDMSKIFNKIALGAGFIATLFAIKFNASSFTFIPYMLGTIITFIPAAFYNSFGKIWNYNCKHEELEDKIYNLEDAAKREANIRAKLNRESVRVSSYDKCKEVSDRSYVEKYRDSKTVRMLRNKGYSDEAIDRYFRRVDEILKQQQKEDNLFENNTKNAQLSLRR